MSRKVYMTTWRNKWITANAKNIDDFISVYEALAKQFRQWKEWGIKFYDSGGAGDDYAAFITEDREVAIKAGFTVKNLDGEKLLETLSGEYVKLE